MWTSIRRFLAVIVVAGGAYLALWPVPVEPIAADIPQDPGFVGDFAANAALDAAVTVDLPEGEIGPEDIAVLRDGAIYTTTQSGALVRIDGESPVIVDRLGGRPLGLTAGPDGALYIADSYRGIMRWTGPGTLEPVVEAIDGAPVIYANQIDIGWDGTIYFSNSTDRFDPETQGGTKETSVMTIWEQSDTGYVARRRPDGSVEKIATGFVYTNGVALSQAEDFLLIAETGRARVWRHWLRGDKAGTREVFLDNLPGYPDNIEAQGDGTFWLAFASPRVPSEALMGTPWLRKVIWRLGPAVRPAPIHRGMMIRFDETGKILENLQDPAGRLGITTGGKVVGGQLYVMTLDSPWFARMAVD